MKQKAVVILKPHLRFDFEDYPSILAMAKRQYLASGLEILEEREVTFSREQAEEFYAEHKGKSFFEKLIRATTMGPQTVLVVEGEDAIRKVRELHGPTNPPDCENHHLRKIYGRSERGGPYNGFHATATPEEYPHECITALGYLV